MDCLKVGEIFIEGIFQSALFFLGRRGSLFVLHSFSHEVFLARMSNQQSSCLFQCLLGLEPVQNNEGSFLALIHIKSVGQDNHHQ